MLDWRVFTRTAPPT